MSAAKHADLLFVKLRGDNDLHVYCKREKIPHIVFHDFNGALEIVKSVVEGAESLRRELEAKEITIPISESQETMWLEARQRFPLAVIA